MSVGFVYDVSPYRVKKMRKLASVIFFFFDDMTRVTVTVTVTVKWSGEGPRTCHLIENPYLRHVICHQVDIYNKCKMLDGLGNHFVIIDASVILNMDTDLVYASLRVEYPIQHSMPFCA